MEGHGDERSNTFYLPHALITDRVSTWVAVHSAGNVRLLLRKDIRHTHRPPWVADLDSARPKSLRWRYHKSALLLF